MSAFAIYPSLKDKTVLVTGGGSGIGAEIVKAFAAQGAKTGFLDFNVDASESLAGETDGVVDFEICDLRDIHALREGVANLKSRLGPASVL
ncbi:MAG: SDR family NAD(P)-dependent oxidoreductase, partial [Roseovarius sp.]|nr:SDR family NAD(P)-dependent oxidoreductase [Roseovarius sp.]